MQSQWRHNPILVLALSSPKYLIIIYTNTSNLPVSHRTKALDTFETAYYIVYMAKVCTCIHVFCSLIPRMCAEIRTHVHSRTEHTMQRKLAGASSAPLEQWRSMQFLMLPDWFMCRRQWCEDTVSLMASTSWQTQITASLSQMRPLAVAAEYCIIINCVCWLGEEILLLESNFPQLMDTCTYILSLAPRIQYWLPYIYDYLFLWLAYTTLWHLTTLCSYWSSTVRWPPNTFG